VHTAIWDHGAGSTRIPGAGAPELHGVVIIVREMTGLPNSPLTAGSFWPRSLRDGGHFRLYRPRLAAEEGRVGESGKPDLQFHFPWWDMGRHSPRSRHANRVGAPVRAGQGRPQAAPQGSP
jgi:hypothetical protein